MSGQLVSRKVDKLRPSRASTSRTRCGADALRLVGLRFGWGHLPLWLRKGSRKVSHRIYWFISLLVSIVFFVGGGESAMKKRETQVDVFGPFGIPTCWLLPFQF